MTVPARNSRKRRARAERKAMALVSADSRLTGPGVAHSLPTDTAPSAESVEAQQVLADIPVQSAPKPGSRFGQKPVAKKAAKPDRKPAGVMVPKHVPPTRMPEPASAQPITDAPVPPIPVEAAPSPAVAPFKSPAATAAPPKPAAAPVYDDVAALNRQNFAAAAQSGAALSDAWEAFGRMFLSLTQASLQKAARTAEQLMLARTLDDVIHVNTQFAMDAVETLVERGAAISQTGAELAQKSLAPWRGPVEANLTHLIKPIVGKPPLG